MQLELANRQLDTLFHSTISNFALPDLDTQDVEVLVPFPLVELF